MGYVSWDWFYYLYSISFYFLIIGFLWKVAIYPIFMITLVFNEFLQKWAMRISMFIPYYFLATYAAFIGAYGMGEAKPIFILIIGGIFLFVHGGMGIVQAQKEMDRDGSYDQHKLIRYRYYALLLALAFYIYLIFDLRPAQNNVTQKTAELIDWIRDIPVLNLIIAAVAFCYAVYSIFIVLLGLLGFVLSRFDKRDEIIDINR